MQTFLPYSSFRRSAATLDMKRLGKQRVETMQIMKALSSAGTGWLNHPATKMWSSYECWLMSYQFAVCREWTSRGYRDTCLEKTLIFHRESEMCEVVKSPPPSWLGNKAFHIAHRSNLIRKLPERYGPLFPGIPDDLEYIWPTGLTTGA